MVPDEPTSESATEATAAEEFGKAQHTDQLFPVVAIGASAGGLKAFTTLLRHLPTDTGMAFVFIQLTPWLIQAKVIFCRQCF